MDIAENNTPFLGLTQPQLGLHDSLSSGAMSDSRKNKQQRQRIAYATRAIFFDNVARGLNDRLGPDAIQAVRVRFLMKHALISRTQAQRFIKGLEVKDPKKDEEPQAPSIDTLTFVAAAFGVTPSEFLTQGPSSPPLPYSDLLSPGIDPREVYPYPPSSPF